MSIDWKKVVIEVIKAVFFALLGGGGAMAMM